MFNVPVQGPNPLASSDSNALYYKGTVCDESAFYSDAQLNCPVYADLAETASVDMVDY